MEHSYSSDLWDEAGLKVISARIENGKKSVQAVLGFLKDMIALGQSNFKSFKKQTKETNSFGLTYGNAPQLFQIPGIEVGTMQGMMTKFLMMIQNLGANQKAWSEKIRLKCYRVLASKSADIFKNASKLVGSIQKLQKDFRAEERKLRKLQCVFEEKVKELKAMQKLMEDAEERKRIHDSYNYNFKLGMKKHSPSKKDASADNFLGRKGPREDELMTRQLKLQTAIMDRKNAEKDLEKHVCFLRGWQSRFNILLTKKLDELEKNETERVILIQQTIKIFIAICREIAVETVHQLDSLQMEIKPSHDNTQFVKLNRTGTIRPPLHTPGVYYEQMLLAEKMSFTASSGLGSRQEGETNSEKYKNYDAQYTKLLQMILGKDKTAPSPHVKDIRNGSPSKESGSLSIDEKVQVQTTPRLIIREDTFIENSSELTSPARMPVIAEANMKTETTAENASEGKTTNRSDQELDQDEKGVTQQKLKFKLQSNRERSSIMTTLKNMNLLKVPTIGFVEDQKFINTCINDFDTPTARIAFANAINRQRNYDHSCLELSRNSFLALAEVTRKLLDCVAKTLDIKPGKLVMIMSQTLFCRAVDIVDLLVSSTGKKCSGAISKSEKVFLADYLRDHDIWKDLRFWNQAFYDSFAEEIDRCPDTKKWHSNVEKQEHTRRTKEILFSQLTAWTHNMREFGMKNSEIRGFIDKIASMNDMPEDRIQILERLMQLRISREIKL